MNLPQEVLNHPTLQRIIQDVEASKQLARDQALEADIQARQTRAAAGRSAKAEFDEALATYEAVRKDTHRVVGELFQAAQAYSRITGSNPGNFDESKFLTINLPSLTNANEWTTGFSTTQAAYQQYFVSRGVWK